MPLTRTATFWLAVVTAAVSLLIILAGWSNQAASLLGFIPARLGTVVVPGAVPVILTPLSATLVHGGFLHLGFNLLMLVWCGVAIERVLGRSTVLVLYVVSAFAAMAAQWVAGPSALSPVIGASGAISGLIGAYSLSFGRARPVTGRPTVDRAINIVWLAAAWAVLQYAAGFTAGQEGLMLATPAHIGGFFAGLLLQRPLLLWRYRKA